MVPLAADGQPGTKYQAPHEQIEIEIYHPHFNAGFGTASEFVLPPGATGRSLRPVKDPALPGQALADSKIVTIVFIVGKLL